MPASRTLFHLDMDAFFASIEVALHPQWRGKPVIVGGSAARRGVVSTCSYEARRFGVHSAMPMCEAERRCPHAIFTSGNHALYREYSEKVMALLHSSCPCVQVVSIDEAYLDVSSLVSASEAMRYAQQLRRQIAQETQLPASVGIASNKLVAKIASGKAKPNGIYQILPGDERAFLTPLPVEKVPGIGKRTTESLHRLGLRRIGDLQTLELHECLHRFGSWGYRLYLACRGIDKRPVTPERGPPKSLSAETTFPQDLSDTAALHDALYKLVLRVQERLRRKGMRTGCVTLKYRLSDFRTFTRSHTLGCDLQSTDEIYDACLSVFSTFHTPNTPLRLLGVSLEKLSRSSWQLTLW